MSKTTLPDTTPPAQVHLEGQIIPTSRLIAEDDELLRTALRACYDSLANARITREEKDGVLHVRVVKGADYKGSGPAPQAAAYAALMDAPDCETPAVTLARALRAQLSDDAAGLTLLTTRLDDIATALAVSEEEITHTGQARRILAASPGQPSLSAPVGF